MAGIDYLEIKESDLIKIKDMPSASQLSSFANVFDNNLSDIHQLARSACNGINNNVKFIRIGDSTRSMKSSEWIQYDNYFLSQINLSYYNNADPSQTAHDWLNNIDQNTFQEFLDNCNGTDGEDTIVEFSLGLNDFTAFGNTVDVKTQVKQILIDSINAILTFKPKVKMYLASPHYAQNDGRRTVLQECYQEISSEFNLFLVDGQEIPIGPTYDYNNTDYYHDGTHLNQFGMLSLNIFILNKILPLDVIKLIEFNEYFLPQIEGNIVTSQEKNVGLWVSGETYSDTSLNQNANYRYIEVPVIPNDMEYPMKYKHQGNRNEIYVKFSDDTVLRISPSQKNSLGYSSFFCPVGVKTIYINLSTDGSNYDLLNDSVELLYSFRDRPFVPYTELTQNFKSNISFSRFQNGKLLDDYGKYGTEGQSLIIDANKKMKWQ